MSISTITGIPVAEVWASRKVSFPLPNCPRHKVVQCSYRCSLENYERLALSTPWDEDATLVLVEDSGIERQEGNMVWFSLRWANIPESWDDASSIAFQYPGFDDIVGSIFYIRAPFTLSGPAKVRNDYFLTDRPWDAANGIKFLRPVLFVNYETREKLQVIGGSFLALYLSQLGTYAVAEESTMERYLGNIWVRKTNFVKVL